jgi:hypothetical protein
VLCAIFSENYINPFENKILSIFEFFKYAKYSIVENRDILIKANEIIQKKIKSLEALHLVYAINAENENRHENIN